MPRELAHDGQAAADDDQVGFYEDPDARDRDGPGLVEVGEHGQEEDEADDAGDAGPVAVLVWARAGWSEGELHRADAEHGDQGGFLEERHLQAREDGDGQHEQGDVGGDVDDGRGDVDARLVDALAGDGHVPVGLDGLAREDEGEDDAERVGEDNEHDDVDGELEPLEWGEAPVEEEEGELCEALRRRVEDRGAHDQEVVEVVLFEGYFPGVHALDLILPHVCRGVRRSLGQARA